MKLYSKRLNNLEELKREKHVLKYALKQSKSEDWLNLDSILKTNKDEKNTESAAEAGILGSIISGLGSKSLFNTVLAMAPPLITMMSKSGSKKKKSSFIERAAKDVILGYIKWKAIELGYKGVTSFMNSKKEERQEKASSRNRKERV
jgi:hypothetical protein